MTTYLYKIKYKTEDILAYEINDDNTGVEFRTTVKGITKHITEYKNACSVDLLLKNGYKIADKEYIEGLINKMLLTRVRKKVYKSKKQLLNVEDIFNKAKEKVEYLENMLNNFDKEVKFEFKEKM